MLGSPNVFNGIGWVALNSFASHKNLRKTCSSKLLNYAHTALGFKGTEVVAAFNLKNPNMGKLAPIIFYAVVGALFLVLLPLANFPPHIGLTAVMSFITAYALYTRRAWAKWLVAAIFFVATTLSLYTVYFIAFSNLFVSVGMLVYAVSTWYFTYYVIIKKI